MFEMSPYGWQDAARFAGISPVELDRLSKAKRDELFLEQAKRGTEKGIRNFGIFINGEPYIGEPRVMQFFEALNAALPKNKQVAIPPASQNVAVKPVKLWVVTGKEPQAAESRRYSDGLMAVFADFKPEKKVVEYSSKEAGGFGMELDFLPAYLIENSKEAHAVLGEAIKRGVVAEKGKYLVLSAAGREGVFVRRPLISKRLDLFSMSQCPYGVMAEDALISARAGKKIPAAVDIYVNYIASEAPGGKFDSLHGAAEWEEDARQLYIAKKYPEKFWKYLEARNKNYTSSMWQDAAAAAGLKPETIGGAFDEAKNLLSENIKRAQELGVNSSPTFLWENRVVVMGLGGLQAIAGFENLAPQQPGADAACSN
jgi:protein-disulfide isomerase